MSNSAEVHLLLSRHEKKHTTKSIHIDAGSFISAETSHGRKDVGPK